MIGVIARDQLRRLYAGPGGWLVNAAAQGLLAWLFFTQLELYLKLQPRLTALQSPLGLTDLVIQPTLAATALALLLAVPLLGMGSLAGERRSGRLALLLSAPTTPLRLVLGKWLGVVLAGLPILLLAGAMNATLASGTHLDPGRLAAALLGLGLVLMLAAAVTLWFSALVEQPLTAAALSWGLLLLAWLVEPDRLPLLSLRGQLEPFLDGLISTSALVWFAAPPAAALLLAARHLAGAGGGRLRRLAWPVAILIATGLILGIAPRHDLRLDLTAGQRNQLQPRTRALLAALPGPVEAEVFMEDYPVQRAALRRLLDKFQRADHRFHWRFTDPAREPERTRRLGIDRTPILILRLGERQTRLERIDEPALADALERLAGKVRAWIGALGGHGEASLTGRANYDLGDFGRLLEQRGYRIIHLDLAGGGQLPDNLDLLVVAAPRNPLAAGELALIQNHLAQGGRLLWLAEKPLPAALRQHLGIKFLPGVVVDAAAATLGIDTPTVAVARPAGDHPLTRHLDGPVLMPGTQALDAALDGPWLATPLLRSSPRSWNETGPLTGVIQRDPGQGEERGPLTLAWLLEQGRGRVVVTGDADFLSNAFLGNGANQTFGLALVRWLSGQEGLVAVPPARPADQQLHWTATTRALIAAFYLIALPLALMITGLVRSWWRRRA